MLAALLAGLAAAAPPPQPLLLYTHGGRVHVVHADGSGNRVVARGGPAAWSPDGELIAFARTTKRRAALYATPADGGRERRLGRELRVPPSEEGGIEQPVWAPDGRLIAFVFSGWIYAADVATGRTRRLAALKEYVYGLQWTRDGSRIVACGGDDALVVTLGGRARSRPGRLCSRTLSPDASRYAFVRDDRRSNGQLWVADRRGHAAKLTNDVPADRLAHFDACCPVWAPDGSRLVFVRSTARAYGGDLFVVNADGTGERRLTWSRDASMQDVSPDGLVAYMQGRDLTVVSARGGPLRTIARSVDWSRSWWQPRRVAAVRQPPVRLLRVPHHRVHVPRIVLPPGRVRRVDVRRIGPGGYFTDMSPDGALLAGLDYSRRPNRFTLEVLDLRTLRERTLTWGAAPYDFLSGGTFSPDGRFVLLRRWRELVAVEAATGRVLPVADDPSPHGVWWLRGDRVAFVDRQGRIRVAAIGGRLRFLGFRAPLHDQVALAPDGRRVLYARECSVWLRDLRTRRERRVSRAALAPGGWAPDGRHFLLAAGGWMDRCRTFWASPQGGYTLYDRRGRRLGDTGGGFASWSVDGSELFLEDGVTGTAVEYLQPLSVIPMATLREATLLRDRSYGPAFGGPGGWIVYSRYDRLPRHVEPARLPEEPLRLYVARLVIPSR